MKTDFHIYNKNNLKISINKIQQLCQIAVITSIFMKNLISTFLISSVNILLFGFLARITDLFVRDCGWKCTLWFFFGIMCALSINYFVRNFRS